MTRDSTSHRIFKISELTRLIASHIPRLKSAVNLACACRYLEEPVLSTLWEKQTSLNVLLEVLPRETWGYTQVGTGERTIWIVGDPPPEAWSRVRRYAAWMRQVYVDEWSSAHGDNTFRQMRLNSPPTGRWFPALRGLSWYITRYSFPYADLFFSPHLEWTTIFMSLVWRDSEIPHDILPAITSTISALPGPNLRYLHISVEDRMVPWEYFKDSFSSVVLRCGSSLTEYASPIPLSDAAVNHLIHLPNLRVWRPEGPPPSFSASPFPPVFPPLTELQLGESAYEWLSLFGRLEARASTTQGVTPLSRMKESLDSLNVDSLSSPMTNFSFASPIRMFRSLTNLNVEVFCRERGVDQCIFELNDDDVTKLAMSLPQLEYIQLGHPCYEDTCATTVACLLSISVYCVKLQELEIHFNTTNIIDDLRNLSEDPQFRELRSLPKCPLEYLDVFSIPLTLDESGFKAMAYGLIDIFPSLMRCEGFDDAWEVLCKTLEHVKAPAPRQ